MTKTKLKKALTEAAVDITASPIMKIIAENGNRNYYVNRAIEELKISMTVPDRQEADGNITTAMTLLAMAKLNE